APKKLIVASCPDTRAASGGLFSPNLRTTILLSSRYLPHKMSGIYARQGVVLSRSVLSGWVDACCRLLAPLDEALQHYVLTDGKL
ncbi:IS66 family transposase, partial [Escherichia coli]|uniref:IS66 family transposase n=3 Tax=Escherichia coli TaxID=562 RepID=UPI001F17E619